MKSLYVVLTLIVINLWNPELNAQNTDLFVYPEPQTVTLTDQQQQIKLPHQHPAKRNANGGKPPFFEVRKY